MSRKQGHRVHRWRVDSSYKLRQLVGFLRTRLFFVSPVCTSGSTAHLELSLSFSVCLSVRLSLFLPLSPALFIRIAWTHHRDISPRDQRRTISPVLCGIRDSRMRRASDHSFTRLFVNRVIYVCDTRPGVFLLFFLLPAAIYA